MTSATQLKSAFKKWAVCLLLLAIFHSQGWAQVGPPPVITVQPKSLTVPNGGTAVFTVVVSSVTTVSYQWFYNGSAIRNATSSILTLNNVKRSANAGTYYVQAKNAAGSVTSSSATLQVNNPPVSANDTYTTQEDVPLIIASPGVLANDVDANGDALTALLVTNVSHGNLSFAANGGFTYTPGTNYNGTDSFNYRASDGFSIGNVATVTINITITPTNYPPIGNNDSYTTKENVPLTIPAPGVLANDINTEGNPFTAKLSDNVSHGSLILNTDGSFTYTPATNYFGSDRFTYKPRNASGNGNLTTVTITVLDNTPLSFSSAKMTADGFSFQLSGAPASTYVIEASTNLTDWTPISTNSGLTGSVVFTDTEAANFSQQFYRAMAR
jgi:VCBS repeat-containing protein